MDQRLPKSRIEAYFISHRRKEIEIDGQLVVDDYPDDQRYEIAVVDIHGRSKIWVRFAIDDENIEIDGKPVPVQVVTATKQLPLGGGKFVDREGNEITDMSLFRRGYDDQRRA